MYSLISNYIDNKRSYAIGLTRRLVQVPTVNPPGTNYEEMAGMLEKELKRIGLSARRILTPKSVLKKYGIDKGSLRINLIADWKSGFDKTLHINGHYDVVPPSEGFSFPPFKGVLKDNRLYGRGAEDMKGTITAMLLALVSLKGLKQKPAVNIQISFTPDEETGGMTGFGWLVREGLIKADCGLSEGYAGRFVSCGNKGILWAKVDCLGKAAHASVPYRGRNAFDAMLEAGSALSVLKRRIERRKTHFRMKSEKDRFATLVLGGELEGGGKVNMVPSHTSFSVDRRLIPEERLSDAREELKSAIGRLARRNKNCRFKMKILAQDRPVTVDTNEEICRAVNGAIKYVFKKNAHFAIMAGGTDMRYLVKNGVPCAGYSAKGGESWHGDDEFVYVDSILDTAKVYALAIMNLGERR